MTGFSLTLCIAESLTRGYNLDDIAIILKNGIKLDFYFPTGKTMMIGGSTDSSVKRLLNGLSPFNLEILILRANGNGSLMRTLPLAFTFTLKKR